MESERCRDGSGKQSAQTNSQFDKVIEEITINFCNEVLLMEAVGCPSSLFLTIK